MKRGTFLASAIIGSALFQIGCEQAADASSTPPLFSALMGADEFRALGHSLQTQLGGLEKVRAAWQEISSPIEHITEDFRNGDIIVTDGWVLSRTEAMHAALFTASMKEHAR